jgi:hypothetical protein
MNFEEKKYSSKTTFLENIILFVSRFKHFYPLYILEYPRKTQDEERGESLCGVVDIV